MPKLLFATTNAHKTDEVRQILGPQWEIDNLRSYPLLPIPDETGTTFEANAIIKALAASLALPETFVLADDSGLEVDALHGAPGVYSARFAGPNATDADNRERLKKELTPFSIANPATIFPRTPSSGASAIKSAHDRKFASPPASAYRLANRSANASRAGRLFSRLNTVVSPVPKASRRCSSIQSHRQ